MALALVTPEQVEAPFAIGCFNFHSTGVTVQGRPTIAETHGAFDFVLRAVKHSGFWMVDLIKYIESREDWGDQRDALITAETGLTAGSVQTYRSVAKKVPPENRVEGVAFGHHQAVASLPADEQVEWLEKSKSEAWTQAELRREVRASKLVKSTSGSAAGVQQLEVVLHVAVESPTYTKAALIAKQEIVRVLKNVPGGLILDAKVALVKARK